MKWPAITNAKHIPKEFENVLSFWKCSGQTALGPVDQVAEMTLAGKTHQGPGNLFTAGDVQRVLLNWIV